MLAARLRRLRFALMFAALVRGIFVHWLVTAAVSDSLTAALCGA